MSWGKLEPTPLQQPLACGSHTVILLNSLSLTVIGIFLFFIAVLLLYHIYFLLHFALQYNNCSKSTGVVKLVVVVDLWPLRRVHPLSARWPFKKNTTSQHKRTHLLQICCVCAVFPFITTAGRIFLFFLLAFQGCGPFDWQVSRRRQLSRDLSLLIRLT